MNISGVGEIVVGEMGVGEMETSLKIHVCVPGKFKPWQKQLS